jgi:hypothetical protein
MSPVTVTEAHRRAGQAGPFPGVGAGALDGVAALDGVGALDCDCVRAAVSVAAVSPAAAAGLESVLTCGAVRPHDATDATSDAAAATANRRPRSLQYLFSMAPS